MTLSNQLQQEYERTLLSVIRGDEEYENILNLMFIELNPSRVISISQDMRKALQQVDRKSSYYWTLNSSTGPKMAMNILDTRPELAALFSVSESGYVREKAVKRWGRINNSFELALLLAKLNDWVGKVRSATINKLEKFMQLPVHESGLSKDTVLGCMDLILNPQRFGRCREVEFRVLNRLLNINGMPLALADYIEHKAVDNAPRYLKLGLKKGILMDALPAIAKQGKHPEVRRIATNALLNNEYTWNANGKIQRKRIELDVDHTEIADHALNDKSSAVKCIALSYVTTFKPEALFKEGIFRSLVSDKRFSVIERAIFGLKILGVDYVEETRQKILIGECSIQSLGVLRRYGTTRDGDLIFKQIDKIPSHYKIHALVAAARLGNTSSINALERIAFDTNNDVEARTASNELYSATYIPNLHVIIESIRSGKNIHSRGYEQLIQKLPTMELALAISELNVSHEKFDCSNLWRFLAKKRNIGVFSPEEAEVLALMKSVNSEPELTGKFHNILGLKLLN